MTPNQLAFLWRFVTASISSAALLLGLSALTAQAQTNLTQTSPSTAEDLAERLQVTDFRIAPNAMTFFLDNGLQVIVLPDHRAPVVTHMVWYKVGSADEPKGKSGIAHLLEHLMFKGTTTHPDGFSERINAIGGQENAFTTVDQTAYFQRVAKEHLGEMMAFEADRMANLVVRDATTKPELDVVLQERLSRVEAEPGARLGEAMTAALFVESAYGRPIIGWGQELLDLTSEDAIAFYNRFYTPSNAVVLVAGDATLDEVKALAEETYGQVAERATVPPRYRAQEPEPYAKRILTMSHPQVTQASVQRQWVVPSYSLSGETGEAEALDMLATLLGGGPTSLLHKKLVLEDKIALQAGAFYNGGHLGPDRFGVFGVPVEGVSLQDLMSAIQAVIDDLSPDVITDKAVALDIRRKLASTIYAQDSQSALARLLGSSTTVGVDLETIQTWPSRIQAVTPQRILDVADRYLRGERGVTGYLTPEENE